MSQHTLDHSDSDLVFAPEDDDQKTAGSDRIPSKPWKILIVDDEPGVHEVTHLSLKNFEFAGRGLRFLDAYTAESARRILASENDIAVALVDVVMENEHAGLDLVRYIRQTLGNDLIRLILRTGQPGQAPERDVIREYDINDYKEKTELTAQKLYSAIFTSLRSYRDLVALDNNRRGLEHIIRASARLFTTPRIDEFIQGVLEQLVALLYLGDNSCYVGCECLAYEHERGHNRVIAATGRFVDFVGTNPEEALGKEVYALIREALEHKRSILRQREFIGYFQPREGCDDVIYITSAQPLSQSDLRLIDLFLHNVSIAYENALLNDEIEGTQRDIVYMLGESIETRSRETGQHVRRVAKYCRLLAIGVGFSEREADIIEAAAPLHDFGKIGIPDGILHNPGRLNPAEWEIMQTHASLGEELLGHSDREILKAASIIAGQHHERWDGTGYPRGLKGTDIHLYGRISAVADVFDALGSKRCYKEAWPLERILDFFAAERGKHFDPALVDWVLENFALFEMVRARYPDT